MDEIIAYGFIICVAIFVILAVIKLIIEFINDKSVELDIKNFDYKRIDNIYEEFILLNKNTYKEVNYDIKLSIFIIGASLIIMPALFLFAFIYNFNVVTILILCTILFIVLAIFVYTASIKLPLSLDKKNELYKEKLIDYIVNELLVDFKHDTEEYIEQKVYDKSGFYEPYDAFFSEDLMTGNLKSSKVELAEVETLKTKEDCENLIPTFHGLFVHIDLKHKVKNNVIITTKDEQVKGRSIVYTQSQEFNELFNVYSNDQIDTYTLLNENAIDSLILLQKLYRITMDIKIYKDDVYLRFEIGPLFDSLIFSKEEKERVYMFSLICDTIKSINESLIN